jgi:hypothetical protein
VPPGAFAQTCNVNLALGEDAGSYGFELGADAPNGLYARRLSDGALFVAPRRWREQARRLLVDRHRFSVEASALAKVTLEHGRQRLVLRRREGALRLEEGPATASVSALVEALETLRADEVAHLGPARADEGFAVPQLRVALEKLDGSSVRFDVGAFGLVRDARMAYTRVAGVDAIYLIARERIEPLLSPFEAP